ncbi:MAG: hypothetical protein B7733_25680 [Myxococcales bacterium FL481]|nr:MAG: hypothetical protein B7733_25680 [Myxococcales bacterium FL481]
MPPLQVHGARKDPSEPQQAGTTEPDDIPLYRTTMPKRPYVELGVVVGYGGKPEDLPDEMRRQAAAMGGDAVIQVEGGGYGVLGTVIAYEAE